jgi:hypothetical protein
VVVDVEGERKEVLVLAQRGGVALSLASSAHDGVTGGSGGPGDVDTHASTGASDKPDHPVRHDVSSRGSQVSRLP